ncbi:PREDICTED: uncharacterized protein LOC107194227 [Dufourea novaeangliae]|uniref:Uncharacterized protein n=1 Tax=Dufourea novaeangliae TaxID=178035 RepID=A0A154P268_DUFNO|nr:PREDICTED: uncharacterized protein LOC107194227 [Dufourea novaeangliae]KZC05922.1 hypothetical protein WN55_06097 [Dufourea novaeangliae]
MHSCTTMPEAPCPPDCPPPKPLNDPSSKYYREIGTAMVGNELIIRMEREKGKSKRLRDWDPPCDCDVVEIQRPTSKEGPKILKGPENNRILFRVQSKTQENKEDGDGKAQGIYYEVGQCKNDRNSARMCRTFTIYPVMDSPCSQVVHTDRVTEGDENVFMLKVRKKPNTNEEPKKNIELELRTPRPSTPPPMQPEEQLPVEKVSLKDERKVKKKTSEEKTKKDVTKYKKKKR